MNAHERTWGYMVLQALAFALAMGFGALLCGAAQAQTWYTANQATLAWDAVTMLDNGQPVPVGDVIKYNLYQAGIDKANPAIVCDAVEATNCLITLTQEGKYLIGIEALRFVAGVQVSKSVLVWSDDLAVASIPFGLMYYASPVAVQGLNVSGQ